MSPWARAHLWALGRQLQPAEQVQAAGARPPSLALLRSSRISRMSFGCSTDFCQSAVPRLHYAHCLHAQEQSCNALGESLVGIGHERLLSKCSV